MSASTANTGPAAASVVRAARESTPAATLAEAYAFCARLARSHYENFSIASWLMPRAMRPSMHAIYAYARMADDFADEEHDGSKLDVWERELDLCYGGEPQHPVFVALADTIRRHDIPREPFADLLTAFRSDLNFQGFETMDDLMARYTRYSANPVGRLVLYLFGYRDEERQRLADLVCTGLQLANFWQDVAIDLDKGRVYFPRADLSHFGVTAAMLQSRAATPEFDALMRHQVEFARTLLKQGAELNRIVDRRLRRDVLMFTGGGLAILRAIESAGYDVFNRRPALRKTDYLKIGWNSLRGRVEA